jgi:hypothetical protein
MPLERILPENLRNRFGGRIPVEHTLGRCSGELLPFPGLAPLQCITTVHAASGFVDRDTHRYYCPKCAVKIQQQG